MKKTDAERLNDYVVAFEVGRLVSRGAINDGTFDGQRLSASKHALSTPNEDVVSECLRWWDDAIKSGLLVERNLCTTPKPNAPHEEPIPIPCALCKWPEAAKDGPFCENCLPHVELIHTPEQAFRPE